MAEKWELLASITENMEKVSKSFSLPAGVVVAAAAAANRGFPTEIIVGRACENCMTVDYVPLPDANTGSYDVSHYVCKNRGKPVEEGEDSQRRLVINIHEKISPETLKRMVDIWLRGHTKYLAAYRLPLERLSALPASGEFSCFFNALDVGRQTKNCLTQFWLVKRLEEIDLTLKLCSQQLLL